MVQMERGQRAGSSSPISGPIDGIRHFVGYPLRSPGLLNGRDIAPPTGRSTCSNFPFASPTRGLGGRRWQGCREDGESVPIVQFPVQSTGSEILWGTPYRVLFVVEFCRLWRPRGGSKVDNGRIGERRPSRFCTSAFRQNPP